MGKKRSRSLQKEASHKYRKKVALAQPKAGAKDKQAKSTSNSVVQQKPEAVLGTEEDVIQISNEQPTQERGVVFISHIPYGFFEPQMKKFFTQFGEVTRLRISRNKKTGRSRHYGWIEFKDPEVADIIAESMNGYYLSQRILVCKRIPPSEVHPELFKGCNKRYMPKPTRKIAREKHNASKSEDLVRSIIKSLIIKERAKRQKFISLGIDYDFPGYEALAAKDARFKDIIAQIDNPDNSDDDGDDDSDDSVDNNDASEDDDGSDEAQEKSNWGWDN